MITERDLQEAIAECLGKRNPDANTCIKLAAYYTIQNELYGTKPNTEAIQNYSYAVGNTTETTINFDSGTEFSGLIDGMNMYDVLPIIDELIETLRVVQPPLYKAVIRKLKV